MEVQPDALSTNTGSAMIGLLPDNAARELEVASCFPEMLRGNSKWRVASRRCCVASQSGELLPGNAAQHLKMASCFPKMLHSIPDFRLSTFRFRALYQERGSRQMLLFCRRKNYRRQAIDFAGRMPDFERRIVILDFRFFGSRRFYKVWGLKKILRRPSQRGSVGWTAVKGGEKVRLPFSSRCSRGIGP